MAKESTGRSKHTREQEGEVPTPEQETVKTDVPSGAPAHEGKMSSRPEEEMGRPIPETGEAATGQAPPRDGAYTGRSGGYYPSGGASSGDIRAVAEAIRNLAGFPTTGPSMAGGPSIQRLVNDTFKSLLGRLPEPNDLASLEALLSQSFMATDVQGRMVYKYTPRAITRPRSGRPAVQTLIVQRAREFENVGLPLLDQLEPLPANADPERADAVRAVVRSRLVDLLNELGKEEGPTAPRVDRLFEWLLGPEFSFQTGEPFVASGHVAELSEVFAFRDVAQHPELVINLDELQNVENFNVFQDYLGTLKQAWDRYSTDDLSILLVRLTDSLGKINELVSEVIAEMDAVGFHQAERETTDVQAELELTVQELVSWIQDFAGNRAPELIRESGTVGVKPVRDELVDLKGLTESLTQNEDLEIQDPQVQDPLGDLLAEMDEALTIAGQILPNR